MSQLLVNRVKRLKSRIDLLIDLDVINEGSSGGFEPVVISDYSDYNLSMDAKLILEIIGIGSLASGDVFELAIDCCWDYEAEERWDESLDNYYYEDWCSQFPKISKKDKIIYLGCDSWFEGFGYVINKNKILFVTGDCVEYNSFLDFLEKYFFEYLNEN